MVLSGVTVMEVPNAFLLSHSMVEYATGVGLTLI